MDRIGVHDTFVWLPALRGRMSVPSEAAFARRYRSLSAAERREFVAALWAARGWETTREAGDPNLVVARHDGRVRRVAVGTPVPDDADVVVGEGTRRLRSASPRRRAEAVGATYVSPADLRDRLCYGVDRDVADRLFRRHFGVDLASAADVPDRDGVGRRVARAGRSVVAGDRTGVGVIAALALLSVTVAVLAAGGDPTFDADAPTFDVDAPTFDVDAPTFDVDAPASDADAPAPSPPVDGRYAAAANAIGTAESAQRAAATLDASASLGLDEEGLTGTVGSTARTPPGVFLTGVHDPDALADAHVAAVTDLPSASVLLVTTGPTDATDPEASTGGRVGIAGDGGVELVVESATRYRITESANASVTNASIGKVSVTNASIGNATHDGTAEVFADGDAVYERSTGSSGVETRRIPPSAAPDATALVGTVAEEPIRRFLNGSESTVRPAATELPLYRIEVGGEPAALDDDVRDFRSVAFVTADGFVLELSATYVHEPTGERVRVAFRYDRLGDAAAAPPAWYSEVGTDEDAGS